MAKKIEIKVTKVTRKNKQVVLDFFEELFTSGKVIDAVYGFTNDGKDYCIELETGDIEITHLDGHIEKISGTDPRAKTFLEREGE